MKKVFTILLLTITTVSYSQALKAVSALLDNGSGKVTREKAIKFTYQEHSNSTTEYSIAYFESIASSSEGEALELWGHGRDQLAIFCGTNTEYNKEQVNTILTRMRSNYRHFKTGVQSKSRLFIHADIVLQPDFVFSAYMDFKTDKYAFWYHGEKYELSEKALILLMSKMELYFNITAQKE
jgi:hypothetical protein